VVDPDDRVTQRLSYAELDRRSTRCAWMLRAAGLGVGDHVAVLLENRAELFEVVWAAVRSGMYVTPINTRLSADEVRYVVRDCGAGVLVASARMAEPCDALLEGVPGLRRRLVVGGAKPGYSDYEEALAEASTEPPQDQCEGETMLYSSGTTGRPKGVKRPLPLGPPGSGFRLRGVFEAMGFDRSTVYLSPAPLYHAAPLGFSMGVHRLGGTVVVATRFDAEQTLRMVERHAVSHAQFVPTMFVRLVRLPEPIRAHYDLSSLRAAVHAAAPCPVDLKRRMIDWWGPILWEYYAGTEGNGMTLIDSPRWLTHPGSVGTAVVGRVRIVRADGTEAEPGETGAVYFSDGPPFCYHNDRPKTEGARTEAGWSTIGDIGHLDDEGYLYLTDRASHMIISGGVNIYPQETENVLVMHPAVADVAVIGVPDPEMGEQVQAVVELADPTRAGPALAAELIDYARARLAHYKCPRGVEFIGALPRQENGKLYKRLLVERYRAGAPNS
jgi:acyl-CoA synthetase (AMP-forming)/AMP-acid ligase II